MDKGQVDSDKDKRIGACVTFRSSVLLGPWE